MCPRIVPIARLAEDGLRIFAADLGAPTLVDAEVAPIDGDNPGGCVLANLEGFWWWAWSNGADRSVGPDDVVADEPLTHEALCAKPAWLVGCTYGTQIACDSLLRMQQWQQDRFKLDTRTQMRFGSELQ
jgi:hypothetical protein